MSKATEGLTINQLAERNAEYVTTIESLRAQLTALTSQLESVVAENAKLADCANFYRLGFKPVKGVFGIEYRATEQLLDDCGNTALEAIKTPATDAFLAEVRAQGVEMYADNLDSSAEDAERDGFDDAVKFLRSEASGVRLFAAQIRKGAAK